jgi:hypothetical protein
MIGKALRIKNQKNASKFRTLSHGKGMLPGSVSDLDLPSKQQPKLVTVDKQSDDDVMHLNRLGKTDRLAR